MLKDSDKTTEHENYIWEPPTRGVETEAMGLENSGSLVKRIFEGASPFAFVREFIQNSIDAGATRIEIGPDFTAVKTATEMGLSPAYKLMFSDNGEGIQRNKMKKLLNKLSSSGRNMDADGNFGIGAKVAALPWNPYGIVFMSWAEDSEGMVRLFRRHDGNYGLFRYNEGDDEGDNFTDLTLPPDDYRENWQKPTGTSVVLLGNSAEEDTIFGPKSDEAGLWGIYRVVEDRYFSFPENTKVSVCVFKTQQRDKWPKNRKQADYHQAHGGRWYLDKYSKDSGTIKAPGAKIHWWWHPDTKAVGTQNYTSPLGYVGALYNHELYDVVRKANMSGKKKAMYPHALVAMYAKFGLFLEEVWNNVTIVVEPDRYNEATKTGVAPDLSRGRLRMPNGEALPWDAWGKAFCEHMPKVIADAIEAASPDDEFDQKDFNKKFKEYFDLMELTSEKERRRAADDGVPRRRAAKKRKGAGASPKGGDDGDFKPTRYNIPAIQWVRPKDTASNTDADLFQGKAVHYEPSANALLFNEEFPLWQKMIERWTSQYQVKSGSVAKRVKEGVRYVYQAAVVTRIVHLRKFRGHPNWSAADIERAMSNESLTVSVLGIHDADRIINGYLKGTIRMKRGDKSADGFAVGFTEDREVSAGPQRFVLD